MRHVTDIKLNTEIEKKRSIANGLYKLSFTPYRLSVGFQHIPILIYMSGALIPSNADSLKLPFLIVTHFIDDFRSLICCMDMN